MDASNSSQLCASCERCRVKKTKCDGKRPCSNCVARYLKINKIDRYVEQERIIFCYFDYWSQGCIHVGGQGQGWEAGKVKYDQRSVKRPRGRGEWGEGG